MKNKLDKFKKANKKISEKFKKANFLVKNYEKLASNTLSKEDIKTQFEKSFKKFENIEYDDDFFININDFDEFLVVSKESYLYNENNILKNLREYCIAA